MKTFLPTYLYVKTHLVTGLKYFGKTTKSDPYTYRGSGVYWIRHCKKHGWSFKTRIVGFYTDKDECQNAALSFSKRHKIVSAVDSSGKKLWANAIAENGLDGGATYSGPRPKSVIRKIVATRLANGGYTHSAETIAKLTATLTGRRLTEEHKESIRRSQNRPSVRKKKSLALKGRVIPRDIVEKARQSNTGRRWTEEQRAAVTGRTVSKAAKRRMSIAQSGKIILSETRAKISAALTGRSIPKEVRAKLCGFVVVVDRKGRTRKIPKEEYYAQRKEPFERSKYVAHRSHEGQRRLYE